MSAITAILTVTAILVLGPALNAQRVTLLHEGQGVSLRGLSVVTDRTVWVSGSKGTVGISTDGGNKWNFFSVPGYEQRDFRDIEAFDDHTALIMATDTPAVILRTTDAGESWKKVFEDRRPGMFLDAMYFSNGKHGVLIGDPVGNEFFLLYTKNGGRSWRPQSRKHRLSANSGEAAFAASGSNIFLAGQNQLYFVSGGTTSRLYHQNRAIVLPMLQGTATQGANSVAVKQVKGALPRIVIVGGDFNRDTTRSGNCVVSDDDGNTWLRPSTPPFGYRSCVSFLDGQKWISCGLTGIDISYDDGINWDNISPASYHVCAKAKKGSAVFLAGNDGKIARVIF